MSPEQQVPEPVQQVPEPEQQASAPVEPAPSLVSPDQAQLKQAPAEAAEPQARPEARRRKPALDQKLAQAKEFALTALKELVPAEEIGDGHRVAADDDRLVTHYFTSTKRGYRAWEWYVTIARAPRQAEPTVCETGILPSDDALLAPEWVPWSERLSDEEKESESDDSAEDQDVTEDAESPDQQDSAERGSQVLHPDVVTDLDDQSGDHHQESDSDESVAPGNSHA